MFHAACSNFGIIRHDGLNHADNNDCLLLHTCLQFTGRSNDARWHLQNGSYAVPTGAPQLLDIFMIDTNPFITRYRDQPWFNNAGG